MDATVSLNKPSSQLGLALADMLEGWRSVHIWSALGWQDVLQRYRRSLLGPLWLTISTGVMVAIMGPLYGRLFGQDVSGYFAHLAIGFVYWQLISQAVNESCMAFIQSESYIKQVRLPLSIHVLRVVWKSLIVLFHNMVVVALVLLWRPPPLAPSLLLVPLGLLAFAFCAYLFGMMMAIVSARFRDIPLIVMNVMQAAFFLTPVLWRPEMLGRHQWAVDLNPFHHFIEIVRAPLLGTPVSAVSWAAVLGIAAFGTLALIAMLTRYRARVAYWV